MAANPSIQLGTDGNWGIKEDNLLAYKKDGDRFFNKEFDFSRGSSATYVAKDGLIKTAGVTPTNLIKNGDFSQEGAELVTNGGFDTDSDWIKQSQWSIANGKATYDGTAFSHVKINQLINTTPNKFYKIKFTVLEETGSNFFFVNFGSVRLITAHLSVGNYEYYAKSDGSTEMLEFYANATDTYSIDNVSVVEVGQHWSTSAGWVINENKIVKTGSTDGVATQSNPIINGKTYKYTFTVSGRTQGNLCFRLGHTHHQSDVDLRVSNNGTFEKIAVANGVTIFLQAEYGFDGYVTNISVQEIQVDTPRIDFTDSPKGALLLEPSSTNKAIHSENLQASSSWNGASTEYNVAVAPDGENTADVAIRNGDNTTRPYVSRQVSISPNSGVRTYSVFVKKSVGDFIALRLQAIYPDRVEFLFQFSTETFTAEDPAGVGNMTIESFSFDKCVDGWYRLKFTINSASTSPALYFSPRSTSGVIDATDIDGSAKVLIWGLQLEENSFATSYIPTYGTTATRLAETCINSGSEQDFNSEEGVLYAEVSANVDGGHRQITVSDGTTNNRVMINTLGGSNNTIRGQVRATGSGTSSQSDYYSGDITQFHKVAVKYKQNDFAMWVDGVEVATDTSGNAPVGLDRLNFNQAFTGNDFYGKVRNLRVFKRALSDTELYFLTSEEYQSYQAMATALNYTI